MIVTEAELRDQLRTPTTGAQVVVPAGARLSPSAADFVKQWGLVTVEQVAASPTPAGTAEWDKASVFPVDFTGEIPTCTSCGMEVTKKASALTQLNAHHFASKTHPRIKLRGRMDSLHAKVLLVQRMACAAGEDPLRARKASGRTAGSGCCSLAHCTRSSDSATNEGATLRDAGGATSRTSARSQNRANCRGSAVVNVLLTAWLGWPRRTQLPPSPTSA